MIVHLDMDCFYAAVEELDHPEYRGKPLAVGGEGRRGVLTTANYEARQYGCHSAMPGFKAKECCPHLIIVPPRFERYKEISLKVRSIFQRFTDQIEPLSLDEAYLDLSHWQTDGATLAREIRAQIAEEVKITASAGIAPNKLLAKICSDWEKPNGQFSLSENEVNHFMLDLPVAKLSGVGRKMQASLEAIGIETCGQMQEVSKFVLAERFGKWGVELYDRCRGIDHRPVEVQRTRKSISKERTFMEDVSTFEMLTPTACQLLEAVRDVFERRYSDRQVRSLVVKLKFHDFGRTSIERVTAHPSPELVESLLREAWERGEKKAVRLLGVGFRLADPEAISQSELFPDP